jgi:heat-inducible transcriptional repressor
MQYPSLTRSTVRHIELVPMGSGRLMLVLIVNTGRVEQRVIEGERDLATPEGEEVVGRLRTLVNSHAVGRRLVDAGRALQSLPEQFEPEHRDLVRAVLGSLEDALAEEREERVVLAGTANLARVRTDFPLTIGPVLEALEQHVVLLKLLGTARESADLVSVRIGHENPYAGLQTTSMVAAEYGTGSDLVAGLGVVGPTRMDYPTTMAAVRAVATYVSRILGE